jgi:hypothetical protein
MAKAAATVPRNDTSSYVPGIGFRKLRNLPSSFEKKGTPRRKSTSAVESSIMIMIAAPAIRAIYSDVFFTPDSNRIIPFPSLEMTE